VITICIWGLLVALTQDKKACPTQDSLSVHREISSFVKGGWVCRETESEAEAFTSATGFGHVMPEKKMAEYILFSFFFIKQAIN